MKFCPTCETRYDEEILRFCTKDGTPLVDEDQPNFTELPSKSVAETPAEDLGEETIVRYNPRKEMLESLTETEVSEAPRIVIPTIEQKQNIRARQIPPYQSIEPKQSVGKVVMLTILGTLAILAMVLGLFVFLRKDEPTANLNVNVNTNPPPDMNLNNNLNLGGLNYNVPTATNLNTNSNTNFNINFNTTPNTNLKTPTPTPTATSKPSPTATANINANVGNNNTNNAPPLTPRPSVNGNAAPNATPKISPTAPKTTPTPLPPGRPANNSNGVN